MKLASPDSAPDQHSRRSIDALLAFELAPLFWRADRIDARSAWCAHVPFAHWLIGILRPQTLVELGTHSGVSYAAFCHSIERHGVSARCYAVDTWAGDAHAGNYDERIFAELSQYHRSRFSTFSNLLRTTFDEAVGHFADGSIDLLHIDGLHTYEAVRHDFETWKPKLSNAAVVLFHDTNERKDDFGVWKFWAELRDEYPSFEFLHGHGLGVLLLGSVQTESLRALAALTEEDASSVRQRFALLGERWEAEQQLLGGSETLQKVVGELHQQMAERNAEHAAAIDAIQAEANRQREASEHRQKEAEAQRAVERAAEQAAQDLNVNPRVNELLVQVIEAQKRTREAERSLWRVRQDGESQLQAAKLALDSMHRHAASLDALRARTEFERAVAVHERDAALATRVQIEASSFWRVSGPMRRLLTRHARLRRAMRTSARLVVWGVTGKLGAQLAARRVTLSNASIIERSPLFDAAWYMQQYDDARHSGLRAAVHYAIVGANDRRNPSRHFDAHRYLADHPAIAATGLNPLVHFEKYGRADGLSVHALPVPAAAQAQTEGSPTVAEPQPATAISAAYLIEETFLAVRPLNVYPVRGEARRITMVTDSIGPAHLFGGVGTAIVFSALLAKRLGVALRLVTRSEEPDPAAFGMILKLNGIEWNENIEFIFSPPRNGYAVPVGEDEIFVTTSWWTTRCVRQVCAPSQIVYLLQEDERMFYPFGDERLRCLETISDSDISVVVNSELLFDHLTKGPDPLPNLLANGTCFEPAFPFLKNAPAQREPDPDEKMRFFFYARPNNLRNLYWRGLEVIVECLRDGTLDPERWEFHFVGKDMPDAMLPHGIRPYLHSKLPWQEYLNIVSRMDIGLSLMDTPHPSYPPFDLAASGAVVVTNQHGCKTSLERYSRNIIATEADIASLKEGIRQALAIVGNPAQRKANQVANTIAMDWGRSFNDTFSVLAERLNKERHV